MNAARFIMDAERNGIALGQGRVKELEIPEFCDFRLSVFGQKVSL